MGELSAGRSVGRVERRNPSRELGITAVGFHERPPERNVPLPLSPFSPDGMSLFLLSLVAKKQPPKIQQQSWKAASLMGSAPKGPFSLLWEFLAGFA